MRQAVAPVERPVADPDVALRVNGVAKAFGTTRAVRDASFELRRGEVHCLVGENGSGKSTLVKILTGVHRPDAGTLEIGGVELDHLASPRAAQDAGVSTVLQEVVVVEPRSVLENVWLGSDGLFRRSLPKAAKRERAAAVLAELLDDPPPLDMPIGGLSLSDRQACCIARALVRRPQVLILDESTSALDIACRDRLFEILRRRAADGASVIFISHRMDEIAEIGDRCTVMRSGETVATLERGQASSAELVRLMTGDRALVESSARQAAASATIGDVVLRARGIVLHEGGTPIDFELRAGELVGLAGLEGHGQDAFIKALWGMGSAPGAITRSAEGAEVAVTSPAVAAAHGVAYVPRERGAESLLASKSILENFGLPTLDRDVRTGLLRHALTRMRLDRYVDRLAIKLASPDDLITTLSGGNQQKIVMARWLATDPQVLLLNDPTRGVDIGAKRELYALLGELVEQRMAIVMLSTEVDEHVGLMDRVLVFREQELSSEIGRDDLSRETLVAAFFGQEAAHA